MVTDLLVVIERNSEQVEMLSQLTNNLVSMTTYSSDFIRDHLARLTEIRMYSYILMHL